MGTAKCDNKHQEGSTMSKLDGRNTNPRYQGRPL